MGDLHVWKLRLPRRYSLIKYLQATNALAAVSQEASSPEDTPSLRHTGGRFVARRLISHNRSLENEGK